jgi:type II secretory pathway pseudopilin PulG
MKTPQSGGPRGGGFTLIEVTVATAILVLIVALLAIIVGQVNKAWAAGQQRVESFQNGRALLELMGRELSQAVISNKLQFIEDPPDLAGGNNLNSMLSATTPQVANSDSLFWQMPFAGNAYGNICEVGYLLTSNTTVKPAQYQLQRYYVPPDILGTTNAGHMFRIYDGPATYAPSIGYTSSTPWPLITGAPWLTQAQTGSLSLAQVKTNFQGALSLLSNGVIGFWARCLDKNGNPIPWLSQSNLYTGTFATQLKFNSAACFSDTGLTGSNGFQYSSPLPPPVSAAMVFTSTAQANLLPDSVELTLVTVDSKTLKEGLPIPSMPQVNGTSGGPDCSSVPAEVSLFMSELAASHISSARVFSTTVRLVGSGYSPITR